MDDHRTRFTLAAARAAAAAAEAFLALVDYAADRAPAARAVAAERGLSLHAHCSRCRGGACAWHGRRGCACATCTGGAR